VVAVPPAVAKRDILAFSSSVYSFGWGEQGRLGLGNEDRAFIPMHVHFPQGSFQRETLLQ
jgi:alpha-tubulin suppressor-like RCC1 family protein